MVSAIEVVNKRASIAFFSFYLGFIGAASYVVNDRLWVKYQLVAF
jgi:hypothetical protein